MKPLVLPGVDYVSFPEFFQLTADQRGWGDIPQLHLELCQWLEESIPHARRCLMAFRHAAKSDITSNYIAWRLYLNPTYECLIVSAGGDLAKRNSKYIRTVIETHQLTRHLVPADEEWKTTQFNVVRPTPSLHSSVACKSLTARITGFHGDEILLDDGEIDENCRNAEAREFIATVLQELMSMSDRMLAIGTPHHELTIYNKLQYELGFHMFKRPVWRRMPVVDPQTGEVLEPGEPAWPEQRGHEWIAEKERTLTRGKFRSQYLLIPDQISAAVIDTGRVHVFKDRLYADEFDVDWESINGPQVKYYIGQDQVLDLRAYWDVATGLEGRDNSVICAVARGESGNFYVVGLEILPPEDANGFGEQCKAVLRFCKAHYVNRVAVENNFARNLKNELKGYANEMRVKIGISEVSRTGRTGGKAEFIGNILEPLVKIRRLYVHEPVWKDTPLRQEMADFPHNIKKGGRHDDCIDALAGCIAVLSPHRVEGGDFPNLHGSTPRPFAEPVVINGDYDLAA